MAQSVESDEETTTKYDLYVLLKMKDPKDYSLRLVPEDKKMAPSKHENEDEFKFECINPELNKGEQCICYHHIKLKELPFIFIYNLAEQNSSNLITEQKRLLSLSQQPVHKGRIISFTKKKPVDFKSITRKIDSYCPLNLFQWHFQTNNDAFHNDNILLDFAYYSIYFIQKDDDYHFSELIKNFVAKSTMNSLKNLKSQNIGEFFTLLDEFLEINKSKKMECKIFLLLGCLPLDGKLYAEGYKKLFRYSGKLSNLDEVKEMKVIFERIEGIEDIYEGLFLNATAITLYTLHKQCFEVADCEIMSKFSKNVREVYTERCEFDYIKVYLKLWELDDSIKLYPQLFDHILAVYGHSYDLNKMLIPLAPDYVKTIKTITLLLKNTPEDNEAIAQQLLRNIQPKISHNYKTIESIKNILELTAHWPKFYAEKILRNLRWNYLQCFPSKSLTHRQSQDFGKSDNLSANQVGGSKSIVTEDKVYPNCMTHLHPNVQLIKLALDYPYMEYLRKVSNIDEFLMTRIEMHQNNLEEIILQVVDFVPSHQMLIIMTYWIQHIFQGQDLNQILLKTEKMLRSMSQYFKKISVVTLHKKILDELWKRTIEDKIRAVTIIDQSSFDDFKEAYIKKYKSTLISNSWKESFDILNKLDLEGGVHTTIYKLFNLYNIPINEELIIKNLIETPDPDYFWLDILNTKYDIERKQLFAQNIMEYFEKLHAHHIPLTVGKVIETQRAEQRRICEEYFFKSQSIYENSNQESPSAVLQSISENVKNILNQRALLIKFLKSHKNQMSDADAFEVDIRETFNNHSQIILNNFEYKKSLQGIVTVIDKYDNLLKTDTFEKCLARNLIGKLSTNEFVDAIEATIKEITDTIKTIIKENNSVTMSRVITLFENSVFKVGKERFQKEIITLTELLSTREEKSYLSELLCRGKERKEYASICEGISKFMSTFKTIDSTKLDKICRN